MSSSPQKYFFDLAMVDVNAISCSASRLLYHGSAHGPFGCSNLNFPTSSVDLDDVEAFSVSLEHLSNFPLSEDYDYQVLYLSEKIYKQLWNGSRKNNAPALKGLASRAQLASRANLDPKTQRIFLASTKNRPMALAPYGEGFNLGHYVPSEYCAKAKEKFKGFLLRTKKGCSQIYNILEAHGLTVVEQREVLDDYDGTLEVRCYS